MTVCGLGDDAALLMSPGMPFYFSVRFPERGIVLRALCWYHAEELFERYAMEAARGR